MATVTLITISHTLLQYSCGVLHQSSSTADAWLGNEKIYYSVHSHHSSSLRNCPARSRHTGPTQFVLEGLKALGSLITVEVAHFLWDCELNHRRDYSDNFHLSKIASIKHRWANSWISIGPSCSSIFPTICKAPSWKICAKDSNFGLGSAFSGELSSHNLWSLCVPLLAEFN